jgi:hypothetical protein
MIYTQYVPDGSKIESGYSSDPAAHLLAYADMLYCLREIPDKGKILIELRAELVELVSQLTQRKQNDFRVMLAHKALVLSNCLEWISGHMPPSQPERKMALEAALSINKWGIFYTSTEAEHLYTWCRIQMCYCRILVHEQDERSYCSARMIKKRVEEHMIRIPNEDDRKHITELLKRLNKAMGSSFQDCRWWVLHAHLVPRT